MKEKLTREIQITEAFDKRSDNPDKDYGIGACRIFFIVKGNHGAVCVNFGTNWFLPSTVKEYKEVGIHRNRFSLAGGKEKRKTKLDLEKTSDPIKAWSWDYHSKKPQRKGQLSASKKCCFIGMKCYCDGSYLRADKYLPMLLEGGSEKVFKQLEKDYYIEFEKVKGK